jgi:hypothetical protein
MVAGQLLAPDDTRLRLAGCRQGILTAEELLALRQTHLTRITAKQHGAAFHRQNDRVALGLLAARSEACVVRVIPTASTEAARSRFSQLPES